MQFIKKTSSRQNILGYMIKLGLIVIVLIVLIFILNQIDFPAPKTEIEKIIPNENFKIVK